MFNFDLPSNIDDYIHRIGRTGRVGNKGTAYSFVTDNCRITKDLYKLLQKCKQEIPEWFENMAERSDSSSFQKRDYYQNKKPYRGGHSSYGGGRGGFSSNYNSNTRENYSSQNKETGFSQAQPRAVNFSRIQQSNYVSVPADYFKKGENFRRDPDSAPRMNYNNFNSSNSGYPQNEQRNSYSRGGYQK